MILTPFNEDDVMMCSLQTGARTVKAQLASIYQKLNVDSRAAAVAIAAQRGLLGE